jgi:hypothetical protein
MPARNTTPDINAAASTAPAIGMAAIALVLLWLLFLSSSSIPLCGRIKDTENNIALNNFIPLIANYRVNERNRIRVKLTGLLDITRRGKKCII